MVIGATMVNIAEIITAAMIAITAGIISHVFLLLVPSFMCFFPPPIGN
jgi:hypothetical protein